MDALHSMTFHRLLVNTKCLKWPQNIFQGIFLFSVLCVCMFLLGSIWRDLISNDNGRVYFTRRTFFLPTFECIMLYILCVREKKECDRVVCWCVCALVWKIKWNDDLMLLKVTHFKRIKCTTMKATRSFISAKLNQLQNDRQHQQQQQKQR